MPSRWTVIADGWIAGFRKSSVTDNRQLDLDEFGTKLGELRGAEGAGKEARHVNDANPTERLDGGMGVRVPQP
jgi:hypothetical protein